MREHLFFSLPYIELFFYDQELFIDRPSVYDPPQGLLPY